MIDAALDTGLAGRMELGLAAGRAGDGTHSLRLAMPGLKCGGCVATVEKRVKALEGVSEARANLTAKTLRVTWRDPDFDPATIMAALRGAGFHAFALDDGAPTAQEPHSRALLRRMAVAGFASANVMLLSVSVWAGASDATRDLLHWLSAVIALPAVAYAGRPFFSSAITALRARRLNMDAPISLAIILALAVSFSEVLRGGEDAYFDAAVMLVFLLLIGRWLDQAMREKARSAAQALARMAPRGAWVLDASGDRHYRESARLRPGERIAVTAGERIPVDGVVEAGRGNVDAALVTGESAPYPVEPGDAIDAGVLSLDAALTVRATRTGEDTTLAEIERLCAAAEERKSRLARLADKAAAIYAPVVHLVALATLAGWLISGASPREAVLAAVAVLIVTCPCALGLAAPMAQAVASGALFRRGVMLKDGAALERLACVEHVVFDKTGVLTLGSLRVIDATGLGNAALAEAAGMARNSSHPAARAVLDYADKRGVAPAVVGDVKETPGAGLSSKALKLGSAAHCGVDGAAAESDAPTCWFSDGAHALVRVTLEDTLRPEAAEAVAAMKQAGLGVTLLSGDTPGAVARVADAVKVERRIAKARPAEKIAYVEALQHGGAPVLMVGDGVNDAPALAAASVSMAPASGSDIGRAASDLVFTGDSLAAVPLACALARRTRRVILQNFALAAAYNSVAIPIAATGLAGPLEAAIAMSSSSLLVTLNALRLTR